MDLTSLLATMKKVTFIASVMLAITGGTLRTMLSMTGTTLRSNSIIRENRLLKNGKRL
jgi:hypothetical protein